MIFARRFLSRTETAVDVGANVGVFIALLARFSKRVIAIEPNPSCVCHLNRVLPSNCEVVAKAASDRADITTLRIPIMGNEEMDALATIETTNNFNTEQRASNVVPLSVECTSLIGRAPTGSAAGIICEWLSRSNHRPAGTCARLSHEMAPLIHSVSFKPHSESCRSGLQTVRCRLLLDKHRTVLR